MTRRVTFGRMLDGAIRLQVSLPGYDALTDDPGDIGKMSFNSDWTDLIRTHQYGLVAVNTYPTIGTPTTVYFPDLGFVPHMEARQADAANVYDDRPINYTGFAWATQATCNVSRGQFTVVNYAPPASIFYIVFREQI